MRRRDGLAAEFAGWVLVALVVGTGVVLAVDLAVAQSGFWR